MRKTQHEEIVFGYNFSLFASPTGAITVADYKLVVRMQDHECNNLMFTPLEHPCTQGAKGNDFYCLYNIIEDPGERQDLSKVKPDILKMMVDRYNEHEKEPQDRLDQSYHRQEELPTCQLVTMNAI